jgi:hypothetical protein
LIAARRLFAKARWGLTVAATKRPGEVGRLPVADQACDIAYRYCPLLDQQLSRGSHPPREQILLEGRLPELRIRALELPG